MTDQTRALAPQPQAGKLPSLAVPASTILPDNKQWQNRFRIPSSTSDRMYTIAQHKEKKHWACDCPGWKRHRKCKHLEAMGLPAHEIPHEIILNIK